MRWRRLAFRIGLLPDGADKLPLSLLAAAEPPELSARWFGGSLHIGTLLTILMFASGLITSHVTTSNRLAVAEARQETIIKRADLQNEQINKLRDDKLAREQYEQDLRRQDAVNLALANDERQILLLIAARSGPGGK